MRNDGNLDHKRSFTSGGDARNRKVRGLWRRGDHFYAQVRVPGEKSARKIPLAAGTLTEAKEAMVKARLTAREGGLPKGGVKPSFANYVRDHLEYRETNQSGRKRISVARERTCCASGKRR
ncbi:MAG: hypothetical protein QOD99_421 [Chthoniobacter sp.]|jgi:hypothetical protein|nr:hypothetical protein [Chthoniobacter sp.]